MTPDFRIFANRNDITATIQDRLLSLRLTDEAGLKSDDVEIVLDDRDIAIELPGAGARLDVALRYREIDVVHMGRYFVDEVELSGPPSTLTVRAKAVDFVAGMQEQKTRAWVDVTLAELVESIAAGHSYQAVVASRFEDISLPHVAQTAESDLNLLVRLARDHGAVIKPMSTRFCFVEEGAEGKLDKLQRQSATLSLTLPGTVHASAERRLRLSGFRRGVDRDWVCRRVQHDLSGAGFTARLDAEVPGNKAS